MSSVDCKIKSFSQCNICDKVLSRCNLAKHKRVHSGEKPYKCNICDAAFSQSNDLKGHQRIHSGERPYKCNICGAAFTLSSTMKQHEKIHLFEKPYKCTVCENGFSRRSSYKDHLRIHTNEKPYKCIVCKQDFRTISNLNYHQRSKHPNYTPKTFHCDVCKKEFRYYETMLKHRTVHKFKDLSNSNTQKEEETNLIESSTHLSKPAEVNHEIIPFCNNQKFNCNACKALFNSEPELVNHKKTYSIEVNSGKLFVINKCKYLFK